MAGHSPLSVGSPWSPSDLPALTGLVERAVVDLWEPGLMGLAFALIPSTASMTASRAITSGEVNSGCGITVVETMPLGSRALARGRKTHSILLFRHLRHGPPRIGSHFI
jgi:hypothetical protein